MILGVSALLIMSACAAAAHNATISNGGEISSPSSGKATFASGEISVTCNTTYSGTFATSVSSIEQELGQTLGSLRSAIWNECSGGELGAFQELPWPMEYASETGALPNEVTGITYRIRNYTITLSTFGGFVRCTYRGTITATMALTRTRTAGVYTSGSVRKTGTLTKVSGTLCPSTKTITVTETLSPTQTITIS